MKSIFILSIVLFSLVSCKKQSGKYCPLVTETYSGHTADISPVTWLPAIMDTLNKYPQLKVFIVNFGWGHDPGSYFANVRCRIFHEGLMVFNEEYDLFTSTYRGDSALNRCYIPKIDTSPEPRIGLEEANTIAEKTIHFEHCTSSRLGFLNAGSKDNPDYRLTWKIGSAESGYPYVGVDAHSGEVLFDSNETQ